MSQRFRNRVLPFALLVLVLSAASAATAAVSNDSRPAAGATPPATQVGSVVISAVTVAGAGSALSVTNLGGDAVDLTGWFVCNAPGYWPLPARTLAAGESFTIHAGSGADTDTDVYAAGGFGSLDDIGEVALYTQPQFEDPGSIVAYVGWNGGKVRKGVAQAAGIWGDADVTLALGDTIVRTGSAPDASAYSVAVEGLPATGSGGLADAGASAGWLWGIVAAVAAAGLLIAARRVIRRD